MKARFNGTCRSCGGRITKGEEIAHLGRGRTFHADCEPEAAQRRVGPVDDSPGALRSFYDPQGVYAADGTYLGKLGGRCEDAPCCGCC